MSEDEFWDLVAMLGGRVEEAAFDRLTALLAGGGVARVLAFADHLDVAVRRLDLESLAQQPAWDSEDDLLADPPALDGPGFLDARAAVICAGRDTYDRVLADARVFAGVWDFAAEMLLYVPVEAYESITGTPWPRRVPGMDEPTPGVGDLENTSAPSSAGIAISRPAWWLVEVAGSYEWEPAEGFLAEPSPRFAIEPPPDSPRPDSPRPAWPPVCTEVAFPAASTQVTQVLRAHGGLPPLQLGRLGVVLTLSDAWDLDLILRPFSGSVRVASDAVATWAEEDAIRAISALAAHVIIEMVRDYRLVHPATPDLRALRERAADLIPLRAEGF